MQQIQYTPIKKAYQRLQAPSDDRKALCRALALDRAEHDEASIKEEAKMRGQAKVLRRQLGSRFGELPVWVDPQLQDASPEQLDHWVDQVLVADTLEQMFSQH